MIHYHGTPIGGTRQDVARFLQLAAEIAMDDFEVVVSVRTDMVGSKVETTLSFDREEWAEMTEKERYESCREEMFNMIDWDYEVTGS